MNIGENSVKAGSAELGVDFVEDTRLGETVRDRRSGWLWGVGLLRPGSCAAVGGILGRRSIALAVALWPCRSTVCLGTGSRGVGLASAVGRVARTCSCILLVCWAWGVVRVTRRTSGGLACWSWSSVGLTSWSWSSIGLVGWTRSSVALSSGVSALRCSL